MVMYGYLSICLLPSAWIGRATNSWALFGLVQCLISAATRATPSAPLSPYHHPVISFTTVVGDGHHLHYPRNENGTCYHDQQHREMQAASRKNRGSYLQALLPSHHHLHGSYLHHLVESSWPAVIGSRRSSLLTMLKRWKNASPSAPSP